MGWEELKTGLGLEKPPAPQISPLERLKAGFGEIPKREKKQPRERTGYISASRLYEDLLTPITKALNLKVKPKVYSIEELLEGEGPLMVVPEGKEAEPTSLIDVVQAPLEGIIKGMNTLLTGIQLAYGQTVQRVTTPIANIIDNIVQKTSEDPEYKKGMDIIGRISPMAVGLPRNLKEYNENREIVHKAIKKTGEIIGNHLSDFLTKDPVALYEQSRWADNIFSQSELARILPEEITEGPFPTIRERLSSIGRAVVIGGMYESLDLPSAVLYWTTGRAVAPVVARVGKKAWKVVRPAFSKTEQKSIKRAINLLNPKIVYTPARPSEQISRLGTVKAIFEFSPWGDDVQKLARIPVYEKVLGGKTALNNFYKMSIKDKLDDLGRMGYVDLRHPLDREAFLGAINNVARKQKVWLAVADGSGFGSKGLKGRLMAKYGEKAERIFDEIMDNCGKTLNRLSQERGILAYRIYGGDEFGFVGIGMDEGIFRESIKEILDNASKEIIRQFPVPIRKPTFITLFDRVRGEASEWNKGLIGMVSKIKSELPPDVRRSASRILRYDKTTNWVEPFTFPDGSPLPNPGVIPTNPDSRLFLTTQLEIASKLDINRLHKLGIWDDVDKYLMKRLTEGGSRAQIETDVIRYANRLIAVKELPPIPPAKPIEAGFFNPLKFVSLPARGMNFIDRQINQKIFKGVFSETMWKKWIKPLLVKTTRYEFPDRLPVWAEEPRNAAGEVFLAVKRLINPKSDPWVREGHRLIQNAYRQLRREHRWFFETDLWKYMTKLTPEERLNLMPVLEGRARMVPHLVSRNFKQVLYRYRLYEKEMRTKILNMVRQYTWLGNFEDDLLNTSRWKTLMQITGLGPEELAELGYDPIYVRHYYPRYFHEWMGKYLRKPLRKFKPGTFKPRDITKPWDGEYIQDLGLTLPVQHMEKHEAFIRAQLIDDIINHIARPLNPDGSVMPGWTTWRPAGYFKFGGGRIIGKGEVWQIPIPLKYEIDQTLGWTIIGPIEKALHLTYDKILNVWRGSVLAFAPRWHFNNLIGNFTLNALGDVSPKSYWKASQLFYRAHKIMKRDKISLVSALEKLGIPDEVAEGIYRGELGWTLKSLGLGRPRIPAEERWLQMGFLKKSLMKWMKGLKALGYAPARVARMSYRVNSGIESWARVAHYVDKIGKGYPSAKAIQSVNKFLFDYSNMSYIERNILRRIIPFWAWTKNITRLAFQYPVEHPTRTLLLLAAIRILKYTTGIDIVNHRWEIGQPEKKWILDHLPISPEQKKKLGNSKITVSLRGVNVMADAITPFDLIATDDLEGVLKKTIDPIAEDVSKNMIRIYNNWANADLQIKKPREPVPEQFKFKEDVATKFLAKTSPLIKMTVERAGRVKIMPWGAYHFSHPPSRLRLDAYGRIIYPVPPLWRHILMYFPQWRLFENLWGEYARYDTGELITYQGRRTYPTNPFRELLAYIGTNIRTQDLKEMSLMERRIKRRVITLKKKIRREKIREEKIEEKPLPTRLREWLEGFPPPGIKQEGR